MSVYKQTLLAFLLLAWILIESVQAVVIATLPSNPRLITENNSDPVPLIIDFDGNGVGDVFMVGFGPNIDFFIATENRAFIVSSPPPNLGGRMANLELAFLIGSDSGMGSDKRWYGGFNQPDTAELIGIPRNSNQVSFGGSANNGSGGIFNNSMFLNASGYFGIEFKIDDATHYGWVHIANDSNLGTGGYIDGWAYETDAGVGISAGAVPEPGVGLMFFVGAIGLIVRRRCAS